MSGYSMRSAKGCRLARKMGYARAMEIRNRLLAKATAEEMKFLEPHIERVALEVGMVLIEPHEPIRNVWFPETALASLVIVLEDGATVESGSVGREGMVGIPILLGTD